MAKSSVTKAKECIDTLKEVARAAQKLLDAMRVDDDGMAHLPLNATDTLASALFALKKEREKRDG